MAYDKELLMQAAHAAATNPEHFNMSLWVSPKDVATRYDVLTPDLELKCNTTLCLGGWCLYVKSPEAFAIVCEHGGMEKAINDALCADMEGSAELEFLFCLHAHQINVSNVIDAVQAFINAGPEGLSNFLANWESEDLS